MPAVARTNATLRIFADDLDPEEVTRLVGIEPTVTRKTDVRCTKSGIKVIAKSGSWHLEAPVAEPGDLNGQIIALLKGGVTEDPSVWRELNTRFRCDVFCGLFMQDGNEGETLEPETLMLLSVRGLKLHLDIYGPGD